MPTLKDQMSELIKSQHRLAVWEALYNHLDSFVSKDGRQVKALRAVGALVELVPPEIIEEILEWISTTPILTLKSDIGKLENQELVVQEEASK